MRFEGEKFVSARRRHQHARRARSPESRIRTPSENVHKRQGEASGVLKFWVTVTKHEREFSRRMYKARHSYYTAVRRFSSIRRISKSRALLMG